MCGIYTRDVTNVFRDQQYMHAYMCMRHIKARCHYLAVPRTCFPLLAASHSVPKSKAVADIYGRLNLTLMRSVARDILARGLRP